MGAPGASGKQGKQEILEGAMAVAHTVARCRPEVVAAYPITPQTHISEELSQIVADGELEAEFVKVESEFGAASVVLGASAAGARAYTATSSQGLMLMSEVLWNIAGMRLPVVLACANRSISAPLSIWCDHQDAESIRDCGVGSRPMMCSRTPPSDCTALWPKSNQSPCADSSDWPRPKSAGRSSILPGITTGLIN